MRNFVFISSLLFLLNTASCTNNNAEITTSLSIKNNTAHHVYLDFSGVRLMDNEKLVIALDSGANYTYEKVIYPKDGAGELLSTSADSVFIVFNDSLSVAFGFSGGYSCAFDSSTINPLCDKNWHFTKNPGYTNTRFEIEEKLYSLAK